MYELFNYKWRMLYDYYPNYQEEWDDEGNTYIVIDGKKYLSEMTLSPKVDDSQCRRVKINRKYYYFS